ncbi:hypothetical protein A0H81_05848 [Grifola frondosa]|uniref:Uncharacterized protein n=1 Tax=Grifola frondosa TaxID=5627 RepID=A0A1C7MBF4_GRIFR|nr:hypothetical protein A0H81_05848 [Grifola frondosa]
MHALLQCIHIVMQSLLTSISHDDIGQHRTSDGDPLFALHQCTAHLQRSMLSPFAFYWNYRMLIVRLALTYLAEHSCDSQPQAALVVYKALTATDRQSTLDDVPQAIGVSQTSSMYSSPNDGELVPQKVYTPHTLDDRRRYVEKVQLDEPIMFMRSPEGSGISLQDALSNNFAQLVGSDDLMFENSGPSVSIRLMDMGSRPMEDGADERWRVGPGFIGVDDLVLVALQHVSAGSWQAHLSARRPVPPAWPQNHPPSPSNPTAQHHRRSRTPSSPSPGSVNAQIIRGPLSSPIARKVQLIRQIAAAPCFS